MKQSLKDFFEGVSIKNTLFTIIWTIGILAWIYFGVSFTETKAEASWAYQESIKLKTERTEIKSTEDDGGAGGTVVAPSSTQVSPEAASEDRIAEALPSDSIEELIYNYFKDDYQVAKAVFTAESGLNPRAKGYNCRYNGISQACKKGDEHKAWSVDCGLGQLNIKGGECPDELYDVENNLKIARQKYDARGWKPWCAFTSKKYLAFL